MFPASGDRSSTEPRRDALSEPRRMRRALSVAYVVLALGVALCCRLTGMTAVLAEGRIHLVDADSHYHAHRIRQALPRLPGGPPAVDPMADPPAGLPVPWPSTFDTLAAIAARVIPGERAAQTAGMALVILLGTLTVVPVFFVGRRLGLGPRGAALGALLLAVWPAHVEYSRLGRLDHHVVEPLFVCLFAWLLLRARRARGSSARWTSRWTSGLAPGAALGALYWFSPTAWLPALAIVAGLLWWGWSAPDDRCRARLVDRSLLAATAVALVHALLLPPELRWAAQTSSLTQWLWLPLGWLGHRWIDVVRAFARRRGLDARRTRGLFEGGLALGVVAAFALTPARTALLATFVDQPLPLHYSEQRSLLSLSLGHVAVIGTYLLIAAPILLWLAARRLPPSPSPSPSPAPAPSPSPSTNEHVQLAALWCALLLCSGVVELRFLPLGLPLLAPLCVLGLARLAAWLQHRVGRRPERRWIRPLLAAALLWAVAPALDYLLVNRFVPTKVSRARAAALRWLHTASRPDEVVLPLVGHEARVLHIAARPVAATPLHLPRTRPLLRDRVAFFTTGDPARARALAQRHRVRWVVSSRLPPHRYLQLAQVLDPLLSDAQFRGRFRAALASRLQVDRGAAARQGRMVLPPLRWLQHAHETRAIGLWRPLEIYRVVRGARLRGHAEPGSRLTLRLRLETNFGRRFDYLDTTRADARGRFQFVLPYPTGTPPTAGWTRALGPVRVRGAGVAARVRVPRAAVEQGLSVGVALAKQAPAAPLR